MSRTLLDDSIREIVRIVEAPFGRPEGVTEACRQLRTRLADPPAHDDLERIAALPRLLRSRAGPAPRALFTFLEELARECPQPWPLLRELLFSAEAEQARRAFTLIRGAAERGVIPGGKVLIEALAERIETGPAWADDPAVLGDADQILRDAGALSPAAHAAALASLLVSSEEPGVRSLAARLLDLTGELPTPEVASRLLGEEARHRLADLLAYTRAGHSDLLALVPSPGTPPPIVDALRRAEAACGSKLLGDVIAALGWPAINLGLEVEVFARVGVGDAFPYLLSPGEATLFRDVSGARMLGTRFLFTVHGGEHRPRRGGEEHRDRVARFRALNLAHAEILPDFIDVAPLTTAKVRRILEKMDRIVAEFIELFRVEADEVSILPSVHADLREEISNLLAEEPGSPELSIALTRKVQTFEDPSTLGDVESLHGLKRYLHQRGLRLGFRLVEGPRGTNRTVALVSATADRILAVSRAIDYADFEPEEEREGEWATPPAPVTLLAAGFGRQLLQGLERVPCVRVFCYGHEAHYYFAFGTHPAFLRIDFSPPLRGGMIDLEYYGVSKSELGYHPAPALPALQEAFRALDFDVQVDRTRVLARYDKERAVGLDDLFTKAEDLLSLVPYWMDLDWVLGSLALEEEGKARVASAWAGFLRRWGVLPIDEILTADRTGILMCRRQSPAGERETVWLGEPPYRDRFHPSPSLASLRPVRDALARISPELASGWDEGGESAVGQVRLDRVILAPLRDAVARGEIEDTGSGYAPVSPRLFARDHEARFFARLLDAGGDGPVAAAAVASLFPSLERTVRFRTSGSVNGHAVERGTVRLDGKEVGLFVLRDPAGVARLACFARGKVLHRFRSSPEVPWEINASLDPVLLATLLRRANVLDAGPLPPPVLEGASELTGLFSLPSPTPKASALPGEIVVDGLRVSPGRAIGPVRFEAGPDALSDPDGGILVAPALGPADLPALERAAAVVSTGGGALSHLGLAAQTLGKPSLIVSGRWGRNRDGNPALTLQATDSREEIERSGSYRIAVRRDERAFERELLEGDLLEVDGDRGQLRLLGRSREARTLHEGFRTLHRTADELGRNPEPRAVLSVRGRRLKASWQVELVLEQLSDPPLIRYAIEEILLGELGTGAEDHGLKDRFLTRLLAAEHGGSFARVLLEEGWQTLERRAEALRARAERRVPISPDPYEILALRLALKRLQRRMDLAKPLIRERGLLPGDRSASSGFDDVAVRSRLAALREERGAAATAACLDEASPSILRPLLAQVRRLDLVLGTPDAARLPWIRQSESLREREAELSAAAASRRVLPETEACLCLHPQLGRKAANLTVVRAILGPERVPSWFAITHRALEEALDLPAPSPGTPPGHTGPRTLREEILAVLQRQDLPPREQARLIGAMWEAASLPSGLAEEALDAYHALRGGDDPSADPPVVAVRSSAREEDLEALPRAGEFETFLFIRGDEPLLRHLRRAWAGLWTERALHRRRREGTLLVLPGGGILVQRLVLSRVSGVLHTANVAEGEPEEMLVNAGLGMGEGVVSGTVPVDHVRVTKPRNPEDPLRFRTFIADKRDRIVVDARSGRGTLRAESPYHQRMRPALEYAELAELVRLALRLEAGFGCPLDLEFALEGPRLWILQARPLGVYRAALHETATRFPLTGTPPIPPSRFDSEVEP